MKAFHNDAAVKEKYLQRVRQHAKADEIIHGVYWKNGKGCAVGCTIHSGEHSRYETELGLPTWLAYLEDAIFEGLGNSYAKEFPERFLSAIKVGAVIDDSIRHKFLMWLLIDEKHGVINYAKQNKDVIAVINRVADLHQRALTEEVSMDEWDAARVAAWLAAWLAARDAAWDAAGLAARAAARDAARDAAGDAAGDAARDAARAAARDAAWRAMADKLIELLSS